MKRRRIMAAATAAVVAIATGLALERLGADEPEAAVVASADRPAPPPPLLEVNTTTTTSPAPTTTTITMPATTTTRAAPRPTAPMRAKAPVVTTTTKPPASVQGLIPISEAGIWVVNATDGSARRLAEATPFDIAGDTILFARGMSVLAVNTTGGEPALRYTLTPGPPPSLSNGYRVDIANEKISSIVAAPDGTAVILSMAPVLGPDGTLNPSNFSGRYTMVDSLGTPIPADIGGTFAWSDDGSTLLEVRGTNLRAYRPDGTLAWGPVATPRLMQAPTWSDDGRFIIGRVLDQHRIDRYDTLTGQWDQLPTLWRHADYGPDGRLIGQRLPEPGWNGFTHPGIVIWDPTSGQITPFRDRGFEAVWSRTGAHVWTFDDAISGDKDAPSSVRVLDATGTQRWAIDFRHRLGSGDLRWSDTSDHLAFLVR